MFVTGAAPNVLGLEFVSKIAGIQISWLQWFLCFPAGWGYLCLSLRRGFPTCCTNRKSHTVKKWQPGRVMN